MGDLVHLPRYSPSNRGKARPPGLMSRNLLPRHGAQLHTGLLTLRQFQLQDVVKEAKIWDLPAASKASIGDTLRCHQTWLAGKLIKDFPIKTSIYMGFYIAMFDYQRVHWGIMI